MPNAKMKEAAQEAAQEAQEAQEVKAQEAFAEQEAQGDIISAIAANRASLRAELLADCAAIASLATDIAEGESLKDGMEQKPILTAYAAINAGALSDTDVNAILCEGFGSKENKGQTPCGAGLSIRKRYRTLTTAWRIANGLPVDKVPAWADNHDSESLAQLLAAMEAGEAAPTTTYNAITTRPKKDKPLEALDADLVAKIAEQLLKPDNIAAIKASEALRKAWASLRANGGATA